MKARFQGVWRSFIGSWYLVDEMAVGRQGGKDDGGDDSTESDDDGGSDGSDGNSKLVI